MDRQRAHSDHADDIQGYYYAPFLAQYPNQAWGQEATPPDSFQLQGGQYGADLNAAHADGQSSQPVDPTPVQGEATGSRRVARRQQNYSKQEDLALCSAYLNVSRDPIIGTNQTSSNYWSRMHSYFHDCKAGPSRSIESLQHRWQIIQRETSMFCGFKDEQDRLNRSGKTEQDRIDDALKAFHNAAKHDFQFLHCWEVLRNTNKWHNWMQGTVECRSRGKRAAGPVDDDDAVFGEPPARPIGRDSAKKLRSEASSGSANNSACLEVLQRLTMSKEKELDAIRAEANAAANHTAVEQEKVALKKELIEIQKRHMELEQRLREEELRERAEDRRLREEERRLREEELREARRLREEELREARRLREEEAEQKIMMMDLSQLDPVRRAYWEMKQKEVLAKQLQRGFHPGG